MAELEEYRRECHTEIEGHYKKTGRAPYSYRHGYQGGAPYAYGGYQGYGGYPDHLQGHGYYRGAGAVGAYPWAHEKLESYNPKEQNTKFLDDMPEDTSPANLEVEGYLQGQNNGKYHPLQKTNVLDTKSPYATMATVKTKAADPVLHKKTIYDLTERKDWRKNTAGDHMKGPIDHVAKNKAAFSNRQQAFEGAGAATSYIKKGTRGGDGFYRQSTQQSPVRTTTVRTSASGFGKRNTISAQNKRVIRAGVPLEQLQQQQPAIPQVASNVDQAIHILEDCGHQEELIGVIRNRKNADDQEAISRQIIKLNQVTPTGMKNYLERGRNLLEDSRRGVNPFANYRPEVPTGRYLKPGEPEMDHYEELGLRELHKTGFVLIAGGLGERLGYSGIKIDLPVCTIQRDYCYLKYYAQYALACRDRALQHVPVKERANFYVPFCIMTSDDTYDRTIALLERNNYFGLGKDRVDIIKQENVPALMDNSARIAVDEDEFKVVTKPHGHGDVHNLLFDSGVAEKWRRMGKDWMVFIQDTNALALKAIPSILGVSRENNW